jgi:hypothetical protein
LGWESGAQVSSGAAASGTNAGVIQGTVIDPSGAVISGGRVTATEESSGQVYRVITESNGFYKFSALRPGKYAVRFEMQGFKTETKTSVIVGSAQLTKLNARLDVGSTSYVCSPCVNVPEIMVTPDADPPRLAPYTLGAIAGQVTDRKDQPIPQVRIRLTGERTGRHYQVVTQCAGLYRLPGLVPGRYTARFEAKGFLAYTKTGIRIDVDQVTQLDAKLKAGGGSPQIEPPCEAQLTGSIAGTVTDPTGAVIPGAQVTATGESTGRAYYAKTDNAGMYRVSLLAADLYTVRFEMKGFVTATKTSVLVSASSTSAVNMGLVIGGGSHVEITPLPTPPE